MRARRIVSWCSMFCLLLPIATAKGQGQVARSPALPPEVDSILGRAIAAELMLAFEPGSDSARAHQPLSVSGNVEFEGTLDASRWSSPGLKTWVAFPANVDHWHRYTVAQVEGQTYRLGGFESPEVLQVDRALGNAGNGLHQRAALLAALADPHGAEKFATSDTASIRAADGATLVLVSTLSYEPHSYAAFWTRYRYAFLFAAAGHLLEWSRVELPAK